MFNSERNETYGVSTGDPIAWTLTTKGFLSDGCSHPVSIYGGHGDDTFDVLRNKCVLDLNGDSGKTLPECFLHTHGESLTENVFPSYTNLHKSTYQTMITLLSGHLLHLLLTRMEMQLMKQCK